MKFTGSSSFIIVLFLLIFPVVVIGQSEKNIVIARKGDGIHILLKNHGLDPIKYTAEFIELNRDKIGKNNTLFAGRKYTIPKPPDGNTSGSNGTTAPPVEVREYAIFGSKYSKVEIIDYSLKGTVFYLMSGHGGPDPGAAGKYGRYSLKEDEYAYDVTIRLARKLIEHGALVYMITRDNNDGIRDESILHGDSDERCYPNLTIPTNQNARLRQRSNTVNNLYSKHRGLYRRLIVIHLDSRSKGENIDVFFYHHKNSRSGRQLADNIHNTFSEKYRRFQPNRTYSGTVTSRSGLYVIRNTHPPTVFIELGNISNQKDQRRFVLYDNRQALANWIAEGIITDYEK